MKILIDTREQTPLDFLPHEFVDETISQCLPVGDYRVEYNDGYIPPVIFERKSLGDLYGTLGKGYDRFNRELDKANKLSINIILIIEASLTKVGKGYKYSRMKGFVVVKRLFTMAITHNIQVVFCHDKIESARYIYEYYCAIGRVKGKKAKNE